MIRSVEPKDTAAIAAIYNHYISHSTISFECEPLSVDQMADRIVQIASHYPYLVYEQEGKLLGYCYAHPWKERIAYQHTFETTVYLLPDCVGRGVGKALMKELILACREADCRALIACITAGNVASESLHRRLGFKQVSHFEQVGRKFGQWLDVVDYELLLFP